jgi:hypothetical protein
VFTEQLTNFIVQSIGDIVPVNALEQQEGTTVFGDHLHLMD